MTRHLLAWLWFMVVMGMTRQLKEWRNYVIVVLAWLWMAVVFGLGPNSPAMAVLVITFWIIMIVAPVAGVWVLVKVARWIKSADVPFSVLPFRLGKLIRAVVAWLGKLIGGVVKGLVKGYRHER